MRKEFNVGKETKNIIKWIKQYFKKQPSAKGAILGISGGKDSTVVSKLLVEALGKEKVFGVLMPNGDQKDIEDSLKVVKSLNIDYTIVNIDEAYNGLKNNILDLSKQALINVAPRLRMTILYAIGQTKGYRVAGTGNKSEAYIGYCTKWGDCACDFNPIANYTTEEVIAIGNYLGIETSLVHKTPSDGLCGKSDEDNLGFTYNNVNQFIQKGSSGNCDIDNKIIKKHENSMHKFTPIPVYQR